MENKNSGPNATTWGMQNNNTHNKSAWLVIPQVGFKIRFSSIDAIVDQECYIVIVSNNITIKIGRGNATELDIFVNSLYINIWLPYSSFEDFRETLVNCFSRA